MIPQNLQDYVKVYEDFLPKDLCASTIEQLDEVTWQEHGFYNSVTNTMKSYDNELSISNDTVPVKQKIDEKVWYALERYILKDFADFDWFNGWSGYTSVRFNKYDPTTKMKRHCDHIHSMFDGQRKGIPIITVLGALNDDYEGGEFYMFGDKKIDMPTGSVIVFPSNFLYPHEVKPVKSGVRYSYVSWAW